LQADLAQQQANATLAQQTANDNFNDQIEAQRQAHEQQRQADVALNQEIQQLRAQTQTSTAAATAEIQQLRAQAQASSSAAAAAQSAAAAAASTAASYTGGALAPTPPTQPGLVDTRSFGKPNSFSGNRTEWVPWAFGFEAFLA